MIRPGLESPRLRNGSGDSALRRAYYARCAWPASERLRGLHGNLQLAAVDRIDHHFALHHAGGIEAEEPGRAAEADFVPQIGCGDGLRTLGTDEAGGDRHGVVTIGAVGRQRVVEVTLVAFGNEPAALHVVRGDKCARRSRRRIGRLRPLVGANQRLGGNGSAAHRTRHHADFRRVTENDHDLGRLNERPVFGKNIGGLIACAITAKAHESVAAIPEGVAQLRAVGLRKVRRHQRRHLLVTSGTGRLDAFGRAVDFIRGEVKDIAAGRGHGARKVEQWRALFGGNGGDRRCLGRRQIADDQRGIPAFRCRDQRCDAGKTWADILDAQPHLIVAELADAKNSAVARVAGRTFVEACCALAQQQRDFRAAVTAIGFLDGGRRHFHIVRLDVAGQAVAIHLAARKAGAEDQSGTSCSLLMLSAR
ncbi:hypothetical protein RHSP_29916 [Rhizobium freirei PRF 81]|uniref:Uncharacterized protein n=1 Tax=Rhizobium freirei PRF 81 TaxID=363754 RepID=N6V6Q4_9HYPH|nr:hypothetical protein RHSP_29916 [Rhizobium freirei PRF 81]